MVGIGSIVLFTLFSSSVAYECSGDDDLVVRAALYLSGASSEEELGSGAEEEISRLEALLKSPLEINLAPRSRLVSSGLFSAYQAASLVDYRSRNGDVLSGYELAMVNGFGEEFVSVLGPFLAYGSSASPGRSSSGGRVTNSGEVKASAKFPDPGDSPSFGYGAKYSLAVGQRFDMGMSLKSPLKSPPSSPESWSLSMGYYGLKRLAKLIVGDYNARFGQGLCIWNGFSMSGFGSAAGLARRPSGLGRYGGFSPSYALRGLAAELDLGPLVLSAFGSIPVTGFGAYKGGGNSSAGFNLSLPGLRGEAGLSAVVVGRSLFEPDKSVRPLQSVRLSLDARYNIKGMDLFGEGALDVLTLRPALVLGTSFRAGDALRLGALARYYAKDYGKLLVTADGFSTSTALAAAARAGTYCSDERGLALAADLAAGRYMSPSPSSPSSARRHTASIALDFAALKSGHLQMKASAVYKAVPADGWLLTTKFKMRLRNYDDPKRFEIGEAAAWDGGLIRASAYLGASYCRGLAYVAYLDGGLAWAYGDGRKLGLALRAGAFHVDNWADRIYVYERDIPGTFNVPALYGRGVWGSFLLNWKFAPSLRLYLHASLKATLPSTTGGKKAGSDCAISLVVTNIPFARPSRPTHRNASVCP